MARAGLGEAWQCLFANDICAKKAKAYAENWGLEHLLVRDVNEISIADIPGQADLAWASFPCQDLSLAGNGAGLKGDRSGTFWAFWKLIKGLSKAGRKPKVIALENVYGALVSHGGKDFEAIAKAMVSEGYVLGAIVVDGVHFVPQSRPRLFIVAVDRRIQIPALAVSHRANPAWHPDALIRAFNRLTTATKSSWRWWSMPVPCARLGTLEDLIEHIPTGVNWHSAEVTKALLNLMAPLHRNKVLTAQASGRLCVGTVYKRTRDGIQRAEVRFDGVSGCLRTPSGGSSRQTILVVDGPSVRSRLLSPREAARLMGLHDSYKLPERYNDAYMLAGDGLIVPAVAHISRHIIEPICMSANRHSQQAA